MNAVQSICNQFSSGELKSHHLDPFGISEMEIFWMGKRIRVSWYATTGNDRDVVIDGQPYPSNKDGSLIIAAAKKRAKSILNEKLIELDKLVGDGI